MPDEQTVGYTLIETIVALLLFTIGVLALVSTSALVGREMNTNAVRERAGRMAASRIEIVGAACRRAASGRETSGLYTNLIVDVAHFALDVVATEQTATRQLLKGEHGGGLFFASRFFFV